MFALSEFLELIATFQQPGLFGVSFGGVYFVVFCSVDVKSPSVHVLLSRQVVDLYVRPDTYGHLVPSMTEFVCIPGFTVLQRVCFDKVQ